MPTDSVQQPISHGRQITYATVSWAFTTASSLPADQISLPQPHKNQKACTNPTKIDQAGVMVLQKSVKNQPHLQGTHRDAHVG
jgi:hypothetical protein